MVQEISNRRCNECLFYESKLGILGYCLVFDKTVTKFTVACRQLKV